MEPLDASFVDAFLAFINDQTANAREAEKRFWAHPYSARLGVFKVDNAVQNYRSLRDAAKQQLKSVLKSGLGPAERDILAKALNDSQFDGYLLLELESGQRAAKPVKIGAMIDYVVVKRRVVPRIYPTISGMQQACEFALMLIANEPQRVKVCRLASCDQFFNTQTSGQRFFCSRDHAIEHENEAKGVRAEKSRARKNNNRG